VNLANNQRGNMAITNRRAERFRTEWDALRVQSGTLDFQMADFIRRVRSAFPGGASGLLQFRQFVTRNLQGITFQRAQTALALLRTFRTQGQWELLGGHKPLILITNLGTPVARRRVKAAALAKARRDGRPVTYEQVRKIALGLGYRSQSARGGGTQTELQGRIRILREYVVSLHNDYSNLGAIPRDVQSAMTRTFLEQITG